MMTSTYQRSVSFHGFSPRDYDQIGPTRRTSRSRSASVIASVLSLFASPAPSKQRQLLASTPPATPTEACEISQDESSTNRQAEAWLQACYNAAVLVFVFITGCIILAVYYVLEPFLYSLLWAILIGMFLHPFQHTSTSIIKEWVKYLESSNIPLSVGLVLSPPFAFNRIAQHLEYLAMSNWKSLLYTFLGTACLLLMYVFNVLVHVYSGMEVTLLLLKKIDAILMHTGIVQLCSLAVGFVVLLLLSRRSEYPTVVKILSVSLWFLTTLSVITYIFGSAGVPVVIALFVSASALNFYWRVKSTVIVRRSMWARQAKKDRHVEEMKGSDGVSEMEEEGSILEKGITLETAESFSEGVGENTSSGIEEEQDSASEKKKGSSEVLETSIESQESSEVKEDSDETGWKESGEENLTLQAEDEAHMSKVSFGEVVVKPATPVLEEEKVTRTEAGGKAEPGIDETDTRFRFAATRDLQKARAQGDQVFLLLFTVCLIVTFWRYPFLLLLLAPFALWIVIKRIFSLAVVQQSTFCQIPAVFHSTQAWIVTRKDVFFPSPLPTMLKMYIFVDKKLLHVVKQSVSGLVSMCMIVGLILAALAVFILLIFEIQVELSHYVSVSATVWNRTVANHPHLKEWLDGGAGNETFPFQDTLGEFANHSYTHAREWLAMQVHSLLSHSSGDTTVVEKRVMDVVDQLYQNYVLKNSSTIHLVTSSPQGGMEGGDSDQLWSEIRTLVADNLETILAVLKSMWLLISENVALVFSLLYALLQLLFSGGTTLLNLVVFITALFYLLCYSEEDYLPVKWVTDLLPNITAGSAEDYGKAFSRAIRSVFQASLRRALFYGLYTWLVHTVFGLSVSILPSVLAAIAGAIPFIGPYWISIPAVLEEWLVEGRPLAAVSIFILSLLPAFFVESIINNEIEGGHPYLAGLAIAGGIYFAGLEGALIGPILLCCLLFVMECYGAMFNN